MDWELIKLIIERVFPKGSKLLQNDNQVPLEERFWVIGNHKGSRWIIPQNPQHGVSILRQWRPYGTVSYLKWQFLLAVYQLGQLQKLPGITSIGIAGAAAQDWQHMGFTELFLVPLIYIGSPGPKRKAVVSLVDKQKSNLIGIAKVPLAHKATAMILQEAQTLTRLAPEKPGLAPNLMYVNPQTGIAVQTPREGKPTGTRLTSAHLPWFSSVSIPNQQTSLQEHINQLQQRIATLSSIEAGMSTNLARILEIIDDFTPLPSVWVHGDFTPWNLKWSKDLSLMAVDWEEAQPNGLPLQDLFHYQYIQSHLIKKKPNLLEMTRKQPLVSQYLSSLGIDRTRYEKLALFYLADSWLRCQEREDWSFATFLAAEISRILGKKK